MLPANYGAPFVNLLFRINSATFFHFLKWFHDITNSGHFSKNWLFDITMFSKENQKEILFLELL